MGFVNDGSQSRYLRKLTAKKQRKCWVLDPQAEELCKCSTVQCLRQTPPRSNSLGSNYSSEKKCEFGLSVSGASSDGGCRWRERAKLSPGLTGWRMFDPLRRRLDEHHKKRFSGILPTALQ